MPTYRYRAMSREKTETEGIIEAFDELAAIELIKKQYPVVMKIAEVSETTSILQTEIGFKKVSLGQLSILSSQFAIILRAGLPADKACSLLAGQTKDKKLKKLMEQVSEDVAEGFGLADSFENKGSDILPVSFIETVRAGESSGTLEHSFENLKVYYANQAKVRAKVTTAFAYPAFLLVLAAIVISIVMIWVMPTFVDMFDEMEVELPLMTRIVLGISVFCRKWWILILLFILLLVLTIKIYSATENGRRCLAFHAAKLPIIGDVILLKAGSQVAGTLSTLLSAGLPLIRSVEITARVLDNYDMSLKLSSQVPKLKEGREIGICLSDCRCFPPLLVEMAAMGEATGTLESTLTTIAAHFDQATCEATDRALGLLQPVLTVILGILIGFIVIALYLPMFTMYGGLA